MKLKLVADISISDTDTAKVGRLEFRKRLLSTYSRLSFVCKRLLSVLLLILNELRGLKNIGIYKGFFGLKGGFGFVYCEVVYITPLASIKTTIMRKKSISDEALIKTKIL